MLNPRQQKKDNLKRKSSSSQNERVGNLMSTLLIAPTDLQELTASLKQGFAQMFQDMDLTKTFALNNEL